MDTLGLQQRFPERHLPNGVNCDTTIGQKAVPTPITTGRQACLELGESSFLEVKDFGILFAVMTTVPGSVAGTSMPC